MLNDDAYRTGIADTFMCECGQEKNCLFRNHFQKWYVAISTLAYHFWNCYVSDQLACWVYRLWCTELSFSDNKHSFSYLHKK